MTLSSNINPAFPQLKVGQVVVYDYLHAAKTWQWTLGTVREITDYTAVVQQWGPHTGDSDTLRSILLREVDTENGRMKSYQDMLALAREKLASIRRSNEDRVSRVRGHFDKAREELERIDEVDLRKVTAQAAPSPVAVAVLKAVWAVAKCDPTAVEFYEWADVQLEYRRRAALDEIAKMDVLAKLYPSAESLQQSLEHGPKLNYKAAARDSPVVASLHAWATTALAYQQAYSLLAHDKRIQEQNDAIAAAIAGMKACRAKIAKLKEELSSNGTTTLPEQVTSFTRTSVLVTIPLSAVISPVSVDSRMKECVLTKDEVEQVLLGAKAMRFQLRSCINLITSKYVMAAAELHTLSLYTAELEQRRLYLQEHYFSTIIRSGEAGSKAERSEETQEEVNRLKALVAELQKHDERWEPDYEAVSVATSHVKKYPGTEWADVLAERFEEVRTAFASETALAAHVDPYCVNDIVFNAEYDQLSVRCEITHPAKMTRTQVDDRLSQMPTRLMSSIYKNRDAPKTGLDKAVAEICHALGIDDHKFAGLGFDEFVTQLSHFDYLGNKDAYESEIGDLLMLLDKINNENRSLQYTLEKSAETFKKQTAAIQRDQDALTARNAELADEIDRLRNLLEKLKDLADKQGAELEHYHMQQQQAQQLRAHRNLSPIPSAAEEPLYAVTIDELNAQKALYEDAEHRAHELKKELDHKETLLKKLDDLLLEAQSHSNDLAQQLQDATKEIATQQQELAVFRQRRHDAKVAREMEPHLTAADGVSPSSNLALGRTRKALHTCPATDPVDPAIIAKEPLYAVTIKEYNDLHDALHRAQEESDTQRAENGKL
ncbi:flagellar attachment zone protein, putative, partial [Leishmania panamensis]